MLLRSNGFKPDSQGQVQKSAYISQIYKTTPGTVIYLTTNFVHELHHFFPDFVFVLKNPCLIFHVIIKVGHLPIFNPFCPFYFDCKFYFYRAQRLHLGFHNINKLVFVSFPQNHFGSTFSLKVDPFSRLSIHAADHQNLFSPANNRFLRVRVDREDFHLQGGRKTCPKCFSESVRPPSYNN